MPFYPEAVAQDLEGCIDEIREFDDNDRQILETYCEALVDAFSEFDTESLRSRISPEEYPGALPTAEWSDHGALVASFDDSTPWDNHEAVNRWAAQVLEGVTTVAADGSNLGPTREFSIPFGLTQVGWCANHHQQDGAYEEGIKTRLLTPSEVTTVDPQTQMRYADSQAPNHERYFEEGAAIVDCIERYEDRDPPAVVLYDGPLVPSFANTFEDSIRNKYLQTMARVLAASAHHQVPVIGYTAGSGSTNIAKMLRWVYPSRLRELPFVTDARIVSEFTESWGDRSILFMNRQDGSVDKLETTYRGESYRFGKDVLFGYLDIPGTGAMDRIELPGWIVREELLEHVISVVRAEAAVGRGYPELLQQADANAVLDADARQEFLALVQRFAETHDLPISWDSKALSKERRRRR